MRKQSGTPKVHTSLNYYAIIQQGPLNYALAAYGYNSVLGF